MRNEALDKNKLNRLVDAMLVKMEGEDMTGFKSKQAAAQAKLTEDDDIQDYKREWVGLTDTERNDIWKKEVGWGDPSHDDEDLMKAIEQSLKEKNT